MMQLKQADLERCLKQLPSSGRKALFIFFPNFEERSVSAAEIVCKYPGIAGHSQVMVFWLQGKRPTEILDEIKKENTSRVVEACRTIWPNFYEAEMTYPVQHIQVFHTAVRERIAELSPNADIFIDISATPRDLLFQLFQIFPLGAGGEIEMDGTKIGSIFFIYSWAKNYPISSGPELLGDLIGYDHRMALPKLLAGKNLVRLAVCGSGTGHDALQAVTVAHELVNKAHITSDVYLLLNRKNVLRSFEQIMRQQSLVNFMQARGQQFNTVFSIPHFSAELTKIARSAAEEHRGGKSTFIIGAFGPKPLALCAYFATRLYLHLSVGMGINSNSVDILDLSGAQYLTLYSLGVGDTDLYELCVDPLTS